MSARRKTSRSSRLNQKRIIRYVPKEQYLLNKQQSSSLSEEKSNDYDKMYEESPLNDEKSDNYVKMYKESLKKSYKIGRECFYRYSQKIRNGQFWSKKSAMAELFSTFFCKKQWKGCGIHSSKIVDSPMTDIIVEHNNSKFAVEVKRVTNNDVNRKNGTVKIPINENAIRSIYNGKISRGFILACRFKSIRGSISFMLINIKDMVGKKHKSIKEYNGRKLIHVKYNKIESFTFDKFIDDYVCV